MPLKYELDRDRDRGTDTFYVYWREDGRQKRKSLRTTDAAEAQKAFGAILTAGEQSSAASKPLTKTEPTVADLWAVYYEKHLGRGHSAKDGVYTWNLLKQHFADLKPGLGEVTQDVVDEYVRLRTSGRIKSQKSHRKVKPQSVRKELMRLIACLNFCSLKKHNQKLINPEMIDAIKLPEESEPRTRWLQDDEIDALHAAARRLRVGDRMSRMERFIYIALHTGSREQAIYDLTWDRVDWQSRTINFKMPGRKQTKKRRSESVPISDELMVVLKQAYKERVNDLVLDTKVIVHGQLQRVVYEAGLAPHDYVVNKNHMRRTGISAHTFRHTAATKMAAAGVDVFDIANILGDTVQTILKYYAKFFVGQKQRDAVNIMSRRPRVVGQERVQA
jgi:integrase